MYRHVLIINKSISGGFNMRIVILIFLLTSFISCSSGNVSVKNDPFSKETVVTFDKWHKVVEGPLDNLRATYTRYIKNGVKSPIIVELEFRGNANPIFGYNGDNLDDSVNILIDDNSMKVKLQNTTKNSSLYIGGMHTGAISSYNIGTICNLTGKFIIPASAENAILNSKLFMLRVSTAGKYTVLKATSGQLDNIKKLVSSNGN